MTLLIPIPDEHHRSLVTVLNRVAVLDWNRSGRVHILRLSSQDATINTRKVTEYCQGNKITDILVPDRLHLRDRLLSSAGYSVHTGPTIANLIHGNGLQKRLSALQLDWRSDLRTHLSHYSLGNVTEQAIDEWLLQFEHLGNHRPVGEHLLKILDVLSLADLGEAICTDAEFFGTDLVVGFNQDKWGKSWATVSNLIGKKCRCASLLPIGEALANSQNMKALRLVEDGLFSGTEIRGVFDSLRGTRQTGLNQKVAKLVDPSILHNLTAQMHFGAVCDFGEVTVRRYMAANNLQNFQVAVGSAARKIRVLRGPNVDPPMGECSDETFRKHLGSRVVPYAFQEERGWPDVDLLQRGKRFCEQVGEQLWRQYITHKQNFDLNRWPTERIRRCALGMDGLGLAFAFPHSVPKATLPLFWGRGEVRLGEDQIRWSPLFPDADN